MTLLQDSSLKLFASLPSSTQEKLLADLAEEAEVSPTILKAALITDWRVLRRPKQRPPTTDWTYWLLRAGRGFGKANCVDTPIPTPTGWTRLGDLAVGDSVFDEDGRPCSIVETFDSTPAESYRLAFSDGTTIDACADHLWTTWEHRDRKALGRSDDASVAYPNDWPTWRSREGLGPRTRSTRDIVDTLTYGSREDLNHSIPACGQLVLPDRSLALDPYVLGAWLGDGSARSGVIYAHVSDHPHWYRELQQFSPHAVNDPIQIATFGLTKILGEMRLVNDKHVPAAYLRASTAQRLALLQGLMDTDGSISLSSHVEFSNTNQRLADAVMELARSLGQKPVIAESGAMLEGRDCGPKWRVTWRPTIPVFRLARKAERVRDLGSQGIRNQHRMIVAAERIDAKPMRCLTVDSPHMLFLAGDGMIPTHNTITAAQWVREKSLAVPYQRGALVAPTFGDGRDTMVEGETGLLNVYREHELRGGERGTAWNRGTGELFLANGTKLKIFSSEQPDRLRGPQHHFLWGEEVSSWNDAFKGDQLQTTWSNAKLGCRLGDNPQFVLTSTPKPNKLTKELLALPEPEMVIVGGSSFENRDNLSPKWWNLVIAPYVGTRLGQQEIEGLVLEDVEGALWRRVQIDALRVSSRPELVRVVVGVDPNASAEQGSNAAGIIIVGLGRDGHGYVIADRTCVEGGPAAWAQAAVDTYHEFEADSIVAEKNNGGEMVRMVMRAARDGANIPIKLVTATRGKRTRAEPIALFYDGNETNPERPEPGRVHHVGGPAKFMDLEEEMVTWTPGMESPDRMDALVWALTELMLKQQGGGVILEPTGIIPGLGTGRGAGDGYDRAGGEFNF